MRIRAEYLEEMGLTPIWRLRNAAADPANAGGADTDANSPAKPMPERNDAAQHSKAQAGEASAGALAVASEPVIADDCDWAQLTERVRSCTACGLCQQRKQAVFGVGDSAADWLFIGEGPGGEEDEQGEPFVGPAGHLLDAMLAALGLARGQAVYIANAVKCRPPANRTPSDAEIASCRPYLERQIALIKPNLIVLLGKVAAKSVLGRDDTLASMRGETFSHQGIPVLVTYHPAYYLRSPLDKARGWEDLCRARQLMQDAR